MCEANSDGWYVKSIPVILRKLDGKEIIGKGVGVAQRVARGNGRIGGERDNDTGSMGVEEVEGLDELDSWKRER